MKKNEKTLISRAKWIQKEFERRPGTVGERIKKIAQMLFLSESTVEKDLKKDV